MEYKKIREVPAPISAEEKYFHGICERLDRVIELLDEQINLQCYEAVQEDVEVLNELDADADIAQEDIDEVAELFENAEEDEEELSLDEIFEEFEETEEEKELRELVACTDYDKLKKDELLIILSHRSHADASKYMTKAELISLAKESE